MTHFFGRTGERVHVLQLTRGDYLLEGIQQVIGEEKISNGFVTSGLGTLETCTMHSVESTEFPIVNKYQSWEPQPIGVAALSGIIANGEPHIHMVMSTYDGDQKTFTGHLEAGCRVLCRMELVIMEIEGVELERALDENGIEVLQRRQ